MTELQKFCHIKVWYDYAGDSSHTAKGCGFEPLL